MYRIFLVEDDDVIAGQVSLCLEKWGYTVRCAENLENIMPELLLFDPHLVLLDIMLPFYNGHHWCANIRKVSKVPVVFLSSASDNMNIVMAMNMGGDDFIAKPFESAVLVAKLQAILRRTYDFGSPAGLYEYDGASLNTSDFTLKNQAQTVELTKNECRILQLLLEQKGKTVSRSALMTRLWESDEFVDENTLTVNIARLRRKIHDAGFADLIRTVKGEGYLIG